MQLQNNQHIRNDMATGNERRLDTLSVPLVFNCAAGLVAAELLLNQVIIVNPACVGKFNGYGNGVLGKRWL